MMYICWPLQGIINWMNFRRSRLPFGISAWAAFSFPNANGDSWGEGRPREFAVDLGYSRKLVR